MKKILFLSILVFASSSIFAQGNIDVTNVYFTDQNSQTIENDELTPGDTVILWFSWDNNLTSALQIGDSLTFGWSIDGVDQGGLILSSLNQTVAVGGSVNAFLRTQYMLPTSGDFTICCWPMYNPYNPNTDPQVGRFCNEDFVIEVPGPPALIDELQAAYSSAIHMNNGTLMFESNGFTQVSIYDLQGRVVLNSNTSNGMLRLPEMQHGTYVVRLMDAEGIRTSKVGLGN